MDTIKFYLDRFFSFFDIKGGVILGLLSIEVLILVPYGFLTGILPADIFRDIYLGAVSAFAVSSVSKHYNERKAKEPK